MHSHSVGGPYSPVRVIAKVERRYPVGVVYLDPFRGYSTSVSGALAFGGRSLFPGETVSEVREAFPVGCGLFGSDVRVRGVRKWCTRVQWAVRIPR